MNIRDSINELKASVGVALSLKTLRSQWKDMLSMFAPKQAEKQPVVTEAKHTVLKMRIGYGKWPHGKGTVITAKKPNFTFGNADIFDVCLNPGNEQVGDVWCSVFFDETLGGYVLMQATGAFNVRVTGDSEPYRPGDWSLFPNGLSYQTFPQSNVLVPLSDKKLPDRVLFSIGNAYFFEAWAYALNEDEEDEQNEPEEEFIGSEEAQMPPQTAQESIPDEHEALQPLQEEAVAEKQLQRNGIPDMPVQEETQPAASLESEDVPTQPASQEVVCEPVFVPEMQPIVPLSHSADEEAPLVLNPVEMSMAREEPTIVAKQKEDPTVVFNPQTYFYTENPKPTEQEDVT